MSTDQIHCELLVLDCDNPEEVTNKLALQPTTIIKKGDIKLTDPSGNNPPILEKRHVWVWEPSLSTNKTPEEHLAFMLDQLRPKVEAVRQLGKQYPVELSIYGHVYHSQVGFHIENDQLKQLGEMSVELDVDIYALDEKD